MNELLAGVRVLDLTNALAASSATKILADLGAEVIKIENPAGGDYTRALMPYIFESHNRNKRSFAVDLKHPEGVALVKQVATTCDVLVQSMRPGAAREVGLSAEDLAVVNPNLIYALPTGAVSMALPRPSRAWRHCRTASWAVPASSTRRPAWRCRRRS